MGRNIYAMKRIFLFFLITYYAPVLSQDIIPLSAKEFKKNQFENFKSLQDELKDISVVALGEATHFGGATFGAKVFMVKFLHQECGFNILAMESPIYEMSIVGERLYRDSITANDFFLNNSRVWNVNELNELYDYIIETYKTDKPLRCVGFNTWSFGARGIGNLFEDFKEFTLKLNEKSDYELQFDTSFYESVLKTINNSGSFKKIPVEDTIRIFNKVSEIRKILEALDYNKDEYLSFWANMSDDLLTMYRSNYDNTARDLQMAKNVLFYKNKYSDEKMILWAATFHVAKDLKSTKFYKKKAASHDIMGVYLKEKLGNKYFVIGFVAEQGEAGFDGMMGLMKRRIKTKKTSIERYVSSNINTEYAYLSLNSPLIQEDINKYGLIHANLFGASANEMKIIDVVDGIFFIKNEELVHYRH